MIRKTLTVLAAIPFFMACNGDKNIDSADTDTDTDSDSDSDSDADTDTDTDADDYLEAVAIGWDLEFGWEQDPGKGLTPVCGYKGGKCAPPYAIVNLANVDYFSKAGSGVDENLCEFFALLNMARSTTLTKGHGYKDGLEYDLWDAFEGTVDFELDYIDGASEPECLNLDPETFPTGDPVDIFAGMKMGLGFGWLTDYAPFDKAYLAKWQNLFAIFVAINHPDGSGGVDFTAYDWSYGYLWQWDPKTYTPLDDGKHLLPEELGSGYDLTGYVRGFSYWYEDFPNLDLSMMKD